MPKVLYLHGFASGPSSTKAKFFQSHLSKIGVETLLPDLNGRDFAQLTLSSQLELIAQTIEKNVDDIPSVVIGSSMGGLLATLCAQRYRFIRALILLAPGFGLSRRWLELLGNEGLQAWEANGFTEVFHYGFNCNLKLNYSFITDAQTYSTDNLLISIPTLVFHGQADNTVPVTESITFSKANLGTVTLRILDSDHSLIDQLDKIWQETLSFLSSLTLIPETPAAGAPER